MKPLHGVILAAILAVGAMLFFLLDSGESRSSTRARQDRENGAPDRDPAPGSGTKTGSGTAEAGLSGATCHASLTVVMPDGSPADGVDLALHGTRNLRARTGTDGGVRFGLLPGSYTLLATRGASAASIRFVLAEEEEKDLGVLVLKEAFVVAGRVYDIRKRPIAGAVVEAIPVDPDEPTTWMNYGSRLTRPDPVAARAVTDAKGAYRLLVPGRGHFAFRASATGYAAEIENPLPVREDLADIDFYLLAGQRLEGKVLDEERQPVAGAQVVAVAGGRWGGISPKAETVTASDGSFALDVPRGNSIQLAARAEGFAPHLNRRQLLTGRPVEIVLLRGIAVRLKTVKKESGRPASGVRVTLTYGSGSRAGETDEFGELALDRIPEPKGRGARNALGVFVGGGIYVAQRVPTEQTTPEEGVVDLGEIEVEAGGVVRGIVRDKQTGKPVADARIRAFGGRASMQVMIAFQQGVRTDGDGKYILTGVNLSTSMILATRDGYVQDIDRNEVFRSMRGGRSIFAEGAREAIVDVELTPASSITGVVLGPDGRPVPGARIQQRGGRNGINSVLGIAAPNAISDASGQFVLSGYREGDTVGLQATHRDYSASKQETAKAGSGLEVALHLEAPLLLTGKVIDEAGRPIGNVRVTVQAKSTGRPRSIRGAARPGITDPRGRFTIRNAPSGELTVSYRHDKYMPQSRDVAVAAGRSEEDLGSRTLVRGPGIEGVVVDQGGKPVAEVNVNAMWTGPPAAPPLPGGQTQARSWGSATTDEGGRFTLYGLREGSYRLVVNADNLTAERPIVRTGTGNTRIVAKTAVEFFGRVVSEGTPVSGAWVRAQLPAASTKGVDWTSNLDSSRTGSDGRFTLRRLPPDSPFDLIFTHNSYKAMTVRGVSASDRGRSFQLDAGIRIAGRVVEPGGRRVSGASLRLFVDSKSSKWARTDDDGRFQFGGLQGTSFEIEVTGSNEGHIKSGKIPVEAGDTAVRIEIERGFEIRGTLIAKSEGSFGGYRIEALDRGGKVVSTGWGQPNREFLVRGLRRGRYTLRFRSYSAGKSVIVRELPGVAAGTKGLKVEITP